MFFPILKNDTTNIIKLFQKLKTKFYIIIWSMGVIALNSSITKEINMKWYLIIRDKCWRCVNFSHPINAILKIKEYSHETIKCCLHKLWDDRLFFIFPDIIMVGIFFSKKSFHQISSAKMQNENMTTLSDVSPPAQLAVMTS